MTSWVIYQEFEYGQATGRFFEIAKSNEYGWMLIGREVVDFKNQEYFIECDGPDVPQFNSDNSTKTVHFELRGDEKSFVVKNVSDSYLYPEYELIEEL